MEIQYHAMANAPTTHVMLSSDTPVKGWYKPDAIGSYVVGKSETVMTVEDAKAYMLRLKDEGGKIVRGADVSQAAGHATMIAIRDGKRQVW